MLTPDAATAALSELDALQGLLSNLRLPTDGSANEAMVLDYMARLEAESQPRIEAIRQALTAATA